MLILIDDKTYRRAAQIVLGFLVVVVLLTFRHYGISWDEEIQSQYGQAILDYYASFFVDHRYKEIFNLYLYGGMFDGLAAYFNAYTPVKIYETRHLLNATFGLLGLWGTWRLGNFLERGQVGLVALILLALTPMYYGHMFNNPKDIPFAAGVIWTLYYMAKTLRAFPHLSLRLVMKLGIFLGLTLGIRVGGVMLLGYWGLSLLIQSKFRNIKALIGLVVPMTALAYMIMLICWPWAQESPFKNPYEALLTFSNFPQDVEVLLDGTIYRSTQLPWYYLPLYFLVQLPLLHLFLIASGLLSLPMTWRGLNSPGQRSTFVLVLLTAFVPPLFATIHHSALYDAVRHFIFVLPLLCILAALGLRQVLSILRHSLKKIKSHEVRQFLIVGFILFLGIIVIFQINILRQLHPYEYIYVNGLNGGVKGALGHYELDYWGSSFKEAAKRLQDYVNKEGGVPPGKIYRIAICGPWTSAMLYLPADFGVVQADDEAEFFLSTTRWMCQNMRPGREIIRVERAGAPLSIIKDLRTTK